MLIGAYENPWTRNLTKNLPFVFQVGNIIRDQTQLAKEWSLREVTPDWHSPKDYAIVARFRSPETGEPVVVAAGTTNFGTQAVGEFLTNSSLLSDALRDAPKHWEEKNLQLVPHTKVLGNTPGTPTVVAKHFW